MKLNVIEDEKDKIVIGIPGDETFTHMIARQAWKEKGEGAAIREHPFMVDPKIMVKGTNPKKILEKSAKSLERECDEFKEELRKALK